MHEGFHDRSGVRGPGFIVGQLEVVTSAVGDDFLEQIVECLVFAWRQRSELLYQLERQRLESPVDLERGVVEAIDAIISGVATSILQCLKFESMGLDVGEQLVCFGARVEVGMVHGFHFFQKRASHISSNGRFGRKRCVSLKGATVIRRDVDHWTFCHLG